MRRYEFYESRGAYDPESHEVQCGGDGDCDFPLKGELGNYLGAQMSALNLAFLAESPTPTPGDSSPTPRLGSSRLPCPPNCLRLAPETARATGL